MRVETRGVCVEGEALVIRKYIADGAIVFDLGANKGTWTQTVLAHHPHCNLHLFEPIPTMYEYLSRTFASAIKAEQLKLNHMSIGSHRGSRPFYFYETNSELSSHHRRLSIEGKHLPAPKCLYVEMTSLDEYCRKQGISRIDFLKIDTEGCEWEVLSGARNLLHRGAVDYIQFEYGGTYRDAGVTLEQVFRYLKKNRYAIWKLQGEQLEYLEEFHPGYENFAYSNFLAVHERLKSRMLGLPTRMFNLEKLLPEYGIKPRGVVHVGAHLGQEAGSYFNMGIRSGLFVEANPPIFETLQRTLSAYPFFQAAHCAASNQNGEIALRVTSKEMSSSILPLKKHLSVYPEILETHQVTVPSKTLDTLIKELSLPPESYNFLNMDIQGAELMALEGATDLLKHIEAINVEVNYSELYEGCPLIEDLDRFLDGHGFYRAVTTTPYHPTWGDALYVRKPEISLSALAHTSDFGIQLMQYACLHLYARQNDLRLTTPPWPGKSLFGLKDPAPSHPYPVLYEQELEAPLLPVDLIAEPIRETEMVGFFQYHTERLAPYREEIETLFTPHPTAERMLQDLLGRIRPKGGTLVGLHLANNPRLCPEGPEHPRWFETMPNEWYLEWLNGFWDTLTDPVLFIVADRPEDARRDFKGYSPVMLSGLEVFMPEARFYPDFYMLTQCDHLAIANRPFSFTAAMLNRTARSFYRPHPTAEKLIPFDPWHSAPVLGRNRTEPHQENERTHTHA